MLVDVWDSLSQIVSLLECSSNSLSSGFNVSGFQKNLFLFLLCSLNVSHSKILCLSTFLMYISYVCMNQSQFSIVDFRLPLNPCCLALRSFLSDNLRRLVCLVQFPIQSSVEDEILPNLVNNKSFTHQIYYPLSIFTCSSGLYRFMLIRITCTFTWLIFIFHLVNQFCKLPCSIGSFLIIGSWCMQQALFQLPYLLPRVPSCSL